VKSLGENGSKAIERNDIKRKRGNHWQALES
jgi:hypothetical protein